MTTEAIIQNLQKDITIIIEKISMIESSIEEISDDLHQVKPEYLAKLKKIEKKKGKTFSTKKDFLHYLKHEL